MDLIEWQMAIVNRDGKLDGLKLLLVCLVIIGPVCVAV